MAAISENKIKEEVRKRAVRDFYILVDEDPFKPDFYSDLIFRAVFPDGNGSREIFYGDELDSNTLVEQVHSPSLWSPDLFLLVRQGERISAKQWEGLLPLLRAPFERCTLVVQCAKVDSRLKFFQAFAKAGDRVALVKFEPAAGGEWNLWLQQFLRESKKELENDARELLQEWTAGSLSELKHTIERAALFAGSEDTIRKEHIQAVGFRVAPEDVFRFTRLMLEGDRAGALALLENLLRQGEEPLAIIGLLSRQYRWLLGILTFRAEGKADQAIASATGIFPSAAKNLFPASRRLGSKRVIQGLKALAETDLKLKSSRLPKEQLMTALVIQLTE